MSLLISHNGKLVDETDPVFTATDRIRLGDGVFDTMLVVVKDTAHMAHSDLHFARLRHDASLLGIDIHDDLEESAQKIISENRLSEGRYALNTVLSRGPGARGLILPESTNSQMVMRLSPLPDEFPPVTAVIAETVRRNEGSLLSRIKSCNYGDNILAIKEAQEKGANESIMLNNRGAVTCTTTGNIFAVIDGGLMTPPLEDGALDGITRKLLIKRYDVMEQSFTADDLASAQGIYMTNSLRGAVPVVSLDGQAIPAPSIPIDKTFHLE